MKRSLATLGALCASLLLPHAAAAGDTPAPQSPRSNGICLGPAATPGASLDAGAPLAPDEDVLWCATPDDPRCAPANGAPGSSGFTLDHTPVATSLVGGRIASPTSMALAFAQFEGRPQRGFRSRLDRPPRS